MKKIIAYLLPLCIIFTMLPMTAFAAGDFRYDGEPTKEETEYYYEYNIPNNKTDMSHYLNVSKMADAGYKLSSIMPGSAAYGNFDVDLHTQENTVEITFTKTNPVGSSDYKLTFTKEGADPVTEELIISIVKLDMNLELRENNSKVDEIKITKGNSRNLTLYAFDSQILGENLINFNIESNNEKVAKARYDGDNIVIDTKAIGTATISVVNQDFYLMYNNAYAELTVTVTDVVPEDGSRDVVISFANDFDSFDMIRVGGELVVPQGSPYEGGKLTAYPGYAEDIGYYEKGSTDVTLYADFIKYLQSQKVTVIDVELEDRPDKNARGTISTIPVEIRALQDYTVSFAPGEGTGIMEDVKLSEKPGEVGVNYKLPTSTFTAPEGKEFDKWFIEDPQTGKITTYDVDSTQKITGNITFTAQWKELPMYNVSYEDGVANQEITVPTDNKDYLEKEKVTVSTTAPTRDGYTFKGWKDETTTAVTITDGKFDMPARDVILTAQWEVIPITDVPKTGDADNVWMYLILTIASLGGVGIIVAKRKIVK